MRPLCPNAFCRAHRRIADGPGSDPDSQSPRPRAPRAYPALLTQMRPPRETAPGGLPWGARSRRVRKQLLQRPSTACPLCSGEAKAVSSARLRSGSRGRQSCGRVVDPGARGSRTRRCGPGSARTSPASSVAIGRARGAEGFGVDAVEGHAAAAAAAAVGVPREALPQGEAPSHSASVPRESFASPAHEPSTRPPSCESRPSTGRSIGAQWKLSTAQWKVSTFQWKVSTFQWKVSTFQWEVLPGEWERRAGEGQTRGGRGRASGSVGGAPLPLAPARGGRVGGRRRPTRDRRVQLARGRSARVDGFSFQFQTVSRFQRLCDPFLFGSK